MTGERAILAGGCFWGMQELIRSYDGVLSTRVGYTGGSSSHATYRNHDGHAEAVEIIFDPARVSYRQILEFFFQIHDPSTRNRQGNDVGTSYRSAIFYTSDEQRRIAEDTIADVDASGLWPGKVVTEVVPAGEFWEAEPEHQDYLQRYPDGYTCHFVRPNWRLPTRTDKPLSSTGSSPMKIFVVMYRTILAFAVCAIGIGGVTLAQHTCLERSVQPTSGSSAKTLAAENMEGGIRWSYRLAMS